MRDVIGCMSAFVSYKIEWADFRLLSFKFSRIRIIDEESL